MSSSPSPSPARRRRRLALPVVLAGSIASLILALGLSPTVAAFTASIQNTVNTAGAGSLIMQENDSTGQIVCRSTDGASGVSTNSATCSTINKYGGDLAMAPGQTVTTNIPILNAGSLDAKGFTLTPGACTQSASNTVYGSATDLCSQMKIKITSGAFVIYDGTVAGLSSTIDILDKVGASSLPAGSSATFTFAVTLPSTLDASYSNLKVSQPLTWTFSS